MKIDLQTQLQRYLGLDEREVAAAISNMADGASTLMDIGANDGYYTLAFLRSEAERVISCEPGPVSGDLLSNAAANGYAPSARFTPHCRLVGTHHGELSLAELIEGCPQPIFIKVDVEGSEVDVLRSSESGQQPRQISWVVETHSLELENECARWFLQKGYQTRVIRPAWWRWFLPEFRPAAHNRWLIAYPSP
ncbi:MAG TPA: FkbM family methyltransferase [Chthoniobacterales bacterium]